MNVLDAMEQQEMIQKLVDKGYGWLIEALYNEEVYTKKGSRLNKSKTCRTLDCKPKTLDDALQKCKEILEEAGVFC
jgi:hypothetical protein